jgi:hypothetical protein
MPEPACGTFRTEITERRAGYHSLTTRAWRRLRRPADASRPQDGGRRLEAPPPLAFQGVDIAGLKAMTAALYAAVGEARTGSLELVAEGDAVFAPFDYAITLPDGSERTSRGLAYYHLTDGRIDVNDVMMMPDPHEVLGPLKGPPLGGQ